VGAHAERYAPRPSIRIPRLVAASYFDLRAAIDNRGKVKGEGEGGGWENVYLIVYIMEERKIHFAALHRHAN